MLLVKRNNPFDTEKTSMKCYTLTENEISQGISLEGLPVDESFGEDQTADVVKVIVMLKERDGIVPDELLDDDVGRASACGRIVLTKSKKDSKGRFIILYDPRQWFIDPMSGKDGFLLYRSRKCFLAVARGSRFSMKNSEGSMKLAIGRNGPVLSKTGAIPVSLPKPDEGWVLATME